ncbi:MAG: hypothetical protein EOM48_05055 [Bacilli bacterium]|nr:hypothetical protein [Bacilli bacterium]
MAQKGIIRNSTAADISAENMAAAFHAMIGSSGILNRFNNLACTKLTDNSVRLDSGVYSLRGFLLHVEPGTTVNMTIDSGTAGQKRNDLIVAELVKNGGGSGIDTLQFKVLKGTSTSGIAVDPTLTQQDVNASGVTCQEALFRVKLDGVTITTIEAVASLIGNAASLATALDNRSIVESGGNDADGYYIKYGDGTIVFWGRIDLTGSFATGSTASFTKNLGVPLTKLPIVTMAASMYDGSGSFDAYGASPKLNGTSLSGFYGHVKVDYAAVAQNFIGVHYEAHAKWK